MPRGRVVHVTYHCWGCNQQLSTSGPSRYACWEAADELGWRKWWGQWFCPLHAMEIIGNEAAAHAAKCEIERG